MYATGETNILTLLRSVSGFSSVNTSRGDWGILNSGSSDHYGIIKPGSFSRTQIAMSVNESDFNTVIQIWQRYKDDGTTLTNLEAHVANIISYFDQYQKLGDTSGQIPEAFIKSGREVEEMWNKSGGLAWLKWDLILVWQAQQEITYAE